MPLKLASVEETAEHLTISPHTVRLWARQGKFRWYKLGSRMIIDQDDLERFVAEQARGRPVQVA
jgi:excisionase family DNA binding protein